MRVLAIDTALGACQAAVTQDGELLAACSEPMDRGHQERLAPMARDVLEEAELGVRDLDRIGVTIGPGSFTGLRVGLAFTKGLSLAAALPCVGVGALEALAAARPRGWTAAAIDARRERIYLQLFNDGAAVTAPELIDVAEADRLLATRAGERLLVVGPGAELLAGPGRLIETSFAPEITAVARLVATAAAPVGRPAPLYLRAPDARTIDERAAATGTA